ncbi:ABC transporter ATP-binding protein [uncultured Eubacterium sp.]|uniref:ABC transporter ATP-binding protein n=1 Tax=uncultured Eubacterium sp. TaxID=165185 RepID=UPI002671AC85|nr:ABC transporter ATP-binding protein [uncultured Eubacterium sp.]
MAESKVIKGPGRRNMGPGQKIEHPFKILGQIMRFVGKYYAPHLIIVVLCIVGSVFANVQGTWFMKALVDQYILPMVKNGSTDFSPLLGAMARVAVFYGIGIVAALVQAELMVFVTQGTLKRLRDAMFDHMQGLPVKYFDTHSHGDIMSMYTNDIDTLRQLISQAVPQMLNSIITVVSVLGCMFALSIPLTVISLVMIGVIIFGSKTLTSLSGRYFLSQQRDLGMVNGYIEEMMGGQKVVKVFCHEQQAIDEFNELNDKLCESANNANKFANIMGPCNAQLTNVSYVICACVGAIIAINGILGFTMTPGALISFLTYNKQFAQPINQITMQMNSIVMALAGADRIFKLLDENEEVDNGYVTLVRAKKEHGNIVECSERTGMWAWKHYHKDDDTTTYTEMKGEIVFDGVDFGYNDEKIVLHDVKLYADPGQKLAFVGSTGAGKTTITNLINRFYDIQDGKIRYDGININKIKKADLRRSLGIVLQDTHLFTATVMENIRYGNLEATDDEVIAAAKLANADSFIRRLPDGYHTMLKGDGGNLSQGQRQLLAIARAAVANPPALILDEATSSIDTRTERIVQEGMDALMKGRTTFVIAHRLSTIKNSDCIMVLEQGRIIERGSHDELMDAKGTYYRLQTGSSASE